MRVLVADDEVTILVTLRDALEDAGQSFGRRAGGASHDREAEPPTFD